MSLHYNAFISYKHADLDNKVAATVERKLEHFHIPYKLRKKTGMKKIERIFRDTDELPLTSDLSGTIADALKNADYLIVICSTNTHKSMWVEREINLFLQNHSQDQVLTVLADGEPADVVPERLKNKEITRVNEAGETETVLEPVEPLSCDFRLPRRDAINIELPRLAAALIGCSYSELINRQRQYKMKRLTAIFAGILALSLGFGAYMLRSNQKISESYRASLISQSKYLSNESEKLLDNEQRIDALHLALAALPDEENPDRPVTVEALRAVTRATMAYVPLSSSNIEAVWTYELPNRIEGMDVSVKNNLFAAIDYTNNVKVWDTESHKELYSYSPKDSSFTTSAIKILDDGNLIIASSNSVISVNPKSGNVNWESTAPDSYFIKKDICLTSNNDILVFSTDNRNFILISSKDGSVANTFALSQEAKDAIGTWPNKFIISPDDTKIAFTYHLLSTVKDQLGIYDITSGETTLIPKEDLNVETLRFSKDNSLFVAYSSGDLDAASYSLLNMSVIKPETYNIICLSPEDYSEKWTYDFHHDSISYGDNFIYTESNNRLTYYTGDVAEVLDASSGELLHHYKFDSPVVKHTLNPDNDAITFITRDGGIASSSETELPKDTVNIMHYFTDDIEHVNTGGGAYVNKRNNNQVIYYGVNIYDKEWAAFKDAPVEESISNFYMDDNVAVLLNDSENGSYLNIYDPTEKASRTRVELENVKSFHCCILGLYRDNILIAYSDYDLDGLIVFEVNYTTGEVKQKQYNEKSSMYNSATTNDLAYADGKLVYLRKDSDKTFVITYDFAEDKEQKYLISSDYKYIAGTPFYFAEQGYVFVSGDKGMDSTTDFIINLANNDLIPIECDEACEDTVYATMNADGNMIATSDQKNVVIKDSKGTVISTIPLFDVETNCIAFYKEPSTGKELLIIPYSDGNICRYDPATGTLLYKDEYETSSSATDINNSELTFDDEHSCIYLRQSNVTNIFDMGTFTELGYVTNSLGYHAPTDTFIALSKNDEGKKYLGYFKHYTLDDLIRKAKEILGNHEMPQEQKDTYGIG